MNQFRAIEQPPQSRRFYAVGPVRIASASTRVLMIRSPSRQSHTQFDTAAALAPAAIATLRGYAIVWNALSDNRGGYRVRMLPGSATWTTPTHALFNHDWIGGPLGDTRTGTMRVMPADSYGQPIEIDLPATTAGRDVLELVRAGRIAGMSFAMSEAPWVSNGTIIDPAAATKTVENGTTIINVKRVLCDEVSIVGLPAFTGTSIAMKPSSAPYARQGSAFPNRTQQALQLERLRFEALQLHA